MKPCYPKQSCVGRRISPVGFLALVPMVLWCDVAVCDDNEILGRLRPAVESAQTDSRVISASDSSFAILERLENNLEEQRPTLRDAFVKLQSFKQEHGRAPSRDDLFEIVLAVDLSEQEQYALAEKLHAIQEPVISKHALIALQAAKRDSVTSFRAEFTYKDMEKWSTPGTFSYAFDRDRFLRDDPKVDPEATGYDRVVIAYDGEVVRRVAYKKGDLTNASIRELESPARFYSGRFPLARAMLFNNEFVARGTTNDDIATALRESGARVFEATHDMNGRDCLLAAGVSEQFYFDIERNFALVRHEEYALTRGADRQITGRHLESRVVHSDFHDYGNGLWLPHNITRTFFDSAGTKTEEEIVEVVSMEVNPQLDSSFFSGVIPEDALVVDRVKDLVYRQSDSASIGDMLSDAVQPKRRTNSIRILSIVVGTLLAGIALYFSYRRKSLEGRQ